MPEIRSTGLTALTKSQQKIPAAGGRPGQCTQKKNENCKRDNVLIEFLSWPNLRVEPAAQMAQAPGYR
jgi:hypothetical protein